MMMNPSNAYDHPKFINLENEVHDWHLIDPMLHVCRLNRILKHKEIQEAYHLAALGCDSIERFDVLQCSDYTRCSRRKAQPREGAQYLTPADCDRCDWRYWDRPKGRPPLYLPFAFDCRLNQIPDEWYQVAVRFRRANGIRDGDRERSI